MNHMNNIGSFNTHLSHRTNNLATNISINNGTSLQNNQHDIIMSNTSSRDRLNNVSAPPLPPMPSSQPSHIMQLRQRHNNHNHNIPHQSFINNGNNHINNHNHNGIQLQHHHQQQQQHQNDVKHMLNKPVIIGNTTVKIENNRHRSINKLSSSSIKRSKILSTLTFDMRRIKKIRRLAKKIRSIKNETSKEYKNEIERIKKEKAFKMQVLREAQDADKQDNVERYQDLMKEIQKEMSDRKRVLQNHCIKELNMIKKRAINYKSYVISNIF